MMKTAGDKLSHLTSGT